MADETKKPGATPATTPKGNMGTELDDAALDKVSGGAIYKIPEPPPPPPPPNFRDWIEL
jgi:hypothetical protein